ncbi:MULTISPECIES: substrate-binding domain-containing protein [Clavibacter]|uniref:LacI family DNA-binding transcriptional regulator n=2 Tax=Clavibacter TaxID=1573 RepID=A0A399NTB3_9MICO|nr:MULTISPECIES: substrate-binding domain-containing protein [Clavibacter]KDP91043.1 LacI family transcription regulator [Clavibacter cf. michiganensis LMG 26808]RII97224.1 LacI family DNA-binding transcriptional regulator [Clavibacter michiganensis]UKF25766.1 substrate-binding domain-containing protein [Clavibacter sp. A6099]
MVAQGRRRVTLSDVAERAGLSVMTASYAFNDPGRVSDRSRERVMRAAAELGYQGANPWARSLRTGRSHSLGVVFGEHLAYAFRDPQAAEFLSGVSGVCTENDLGLTLIPTTGGPGDRDRVAAAAVDGYVFWTTSDDDPSLAAAVGTGRPCAIQGGPDVDGMTRIGPDDRRAAGELGALGLVGSRSPLIVSFPLDRSRTAWQGDGLPLEQATMPVTRERLRGFGDALTVAGFDPSAVPVVALARNGREEARRAVSAFLADGRPADSFLCMSDETAIGALEAAAEAGLRVPDDLSVVGWDDGPRAAELGLTSLHQSMLDQGRACGQIAAGLTPTDAGSGAGWHVVARGTTRSR